LRVAALAGIAGVAVQCVWDATLRMPANAMLLALLAALAVHERRAGTGRSDRRRQYRRHQRHGDADDNDNDGENDD
jgi:hypothetical protein